MDRRLTALAGTLAVLLLGACASTPPAPASSASTAGPTPAAAKPAIPAKLAAANYRIKQKNGEELYCRRELLTGSRTRSTETCLTAAQLEKERNGVDQLLRRVQDMNSSQGSTDGSGGQFNNVMTVGGRSGGQ